MRWTQKVSVWPVAFSSNSYYKRPICKNNRVISWLCQGKCKSSDVLDSIGYATNLQHLVRKLGVQFTSKSHFNFIKKLVQLNELEPKADNCTKVTIL